MTWKLPATGSRCWTIGNFNSQSGNTLPASHAGADAAGTGLGEAIYFGMEIATSWQARREATPTSPPRPSGNRAVASHEKAPRVRERGANPVRPWVPHACTNFWMHLCGAPSFDGPDDDAASEITRLGLEGQCPVCVQTLDLWTSVYGAEAGNLALKVLCSRRRMGRRRDRRQDP